MTAFAPTTGRRRQITYQRPWLYEAQAAFLFTPARYSLVEATTKSGKTQGCLIWFLEKALLEGFEGWNGWWVAPVHGQAAIAFRRMKNFIRPLGPLVRKNDTDKTITLPNGAVLWFKSGEKPDNLYGEDVYVAVIDEASRLREEAWYAVRSTLTATRGPVRIIGNVKGRKNWFYAMARKAESGEPDMYYAKLTAWHAVDAGILDRAEVEDARRHLPEHVFNELYLAEPSDDGGNPFGIAAIRASIMRDADGVSRLAAGPPAAWGIDLAKSVDWTVLTGLNRAGKMCAFERYRRSWSATKAHIRASVGSVRTLIDSTGVGDPVVEDLQHGRDTITGFKFSPSSKQMLMEGLAARIQEAADRGEPFIYAGPGNVVINELEVFEFVYTKTGVRYAAPEGYHDDTVCALALAVEQHRQLGRAPSRGGAVVNF